MNSKLKSSEELLNLDPISGAPGAHRLGTGVGAAVGGAASDATVGTIAGPVGTVIGAAAGAIVGGLAGKAVAEQMDQTAEVAYWRDNFTSRPYVDGDANFDDYAPAYIYGVHSSPNFAGRTFDDVETDLSSGWDSVRGKSSLSWDRARNATRDAWDRVRKTT